MPADLPNILFQTVSFLMITGVYGVGIILLARNDRTSLEVWNVRGIGQAASMSIVGLGLILIGLPAPSRLEWSTMIPSGATALLCLVIAWNWHSQRRSAVMRNRTGAGPICPGCGYDLHGRTSGPCPECGRLTDSR